MSTLHQTSIGKYHIEMDSDGVYHSYQKEEIPLHMVLTSLDMNETFMFQTFHSSSQRKLRAHNKKLNKSKEA